MTMIGTQESGEQISSIMYNSNNLLDGVNQSSIDGVCNVGRSIDFARLPSKKGMNQSNTCDSDFFSKMDVHETTKNTDES